MTKLSVYTGKGPGHYRNNILFSGEPDKTNPGHLNPLESLINQIQTEDKRTADTKE
jgi:hypothetical protein